MDLTSQERDGTDEMGVVGVGRAIEEREINGRLWWKGDIVHAWPCTVELNEDAVPGHATQGWCHGCKAVHYIDADGLGAAWTLFSTKYDR